MNAPNSGFSVVNVIGPLLFVLAVAAVFSRLSFERTTPGDAESAVQVEASEAYSGFREEVYFPVRALLTGTDPYSESYESFHPESASCPPVIPSTLILHTPFGFLSLAVAETCYLVINVLLVVLISCLLIRSCDADLPWGAIALLSAVMILCVPGLEHFRLLGSSVLVLFGCVLALGYANKPVLSGFGVLLACCQPLVGFLLAFYLLCRRHVSAFAFAIFLILVVNGIGIAWLASQTGQDLKQTVERVQANCSIGTLAESPETAMFSKSTLVEVSEKWYELPSQDLGWPVIFWLACLGLGCLILLLEFNPSQRDGLHSRTGTWIVLMLVLAAGFQASTLLLIWIPIVGLVLGAIQIQNGIATPLRILLMFALVVPMVNFVSSSAGFEWLNLDVAQTWNGPGEFQFHWQEKLAVTVNGMILALAGLIVLLSIFASGLTLQGEDDFAQIE